MDCEEAGVKNIVRKKCITVVIPTLLLCPKDIFAYTLNQLEQCDLVKNIVIIDNTETKEFDKHFLLTGKIKHLKMPGNQGATYNPGMELCDTDYYLLINDDVACRSSIIENCFYIMEFDSNIGLIQINTFCNNVFKCPVLRNAHFIHYIEHLLNKMSRINPKFIRKS